MTSFIVMDVLEKAGEMERNGIDVVHLEVGEPDFDIPQCASDAVKQALDEGDTHYTHSLGIIELREEICNYYQKRYGVEITPDRVMVTSGTSPAMLSLFSVLLEAGDEVIVSDPQYACYLNFINCTGGVPVTVPVTEEDGFQLRIDDIKAKLTDRTKAILINSPSNPTGTLLSAERMKEIAEIGKPIVSDEIYHGLVYEGREHSILEFTDNAFVLNGFSKRFAMTGIRLGYLIAPKEYMWPLQKVQQNFFICANSLAQKAGLAALRHGEDDTLRMKKIYNERRLYMISRLKEMGFSLPVEPTGAFYVLLNVKDITSDSYSLAFDILEKAHVGVTPGIDFGKGGEGYIRFSYANSIENIEKGMDRLAAYFKDYHKKS